jgi:hypothetical protein
VHFLFSPPYWPAYNGAIEATIGSLKKRTELQAAQHGHPGLWTTADVAAARCAANVDCPRRLHRQTPAEAWATRTPISALERTCFELAVARERFVARSECGLDQHEHLDHWRQADVDRIALTRALVGHDYLLFTRRRIPLTIRAGQVTILG